MQYLTNAVAGVKKRAAEFYTSYETTRIPMWSGERRQLMSAKMMMMMMMNAASATRVADK